MTDGDALLAAVLAAPGDDAPRLVYADWLDENGQPRRAEFIRVQCELKAKFTSRLGVMHYLTCDIGKCHPCDLRRRERELLTLANFERWSVELPVTIAQNFSRGFVHDISCPAADWLAHADAITSQHPVREVRLTTNPTYFYLEGDKWIDQNDGYPFWLNIDEAKLSCQSRWPGITFHLPEPGDARIVRLPGDWLFRDYAAEGLDQAREAGRRLAEMENREFWRRFLNEPVEHVHFG